jgi:hypothetical protein
MEEFDEKPRWKITAKTTEKGGWVGQENCIKLSSKKEVKSQIYYSRF